MLGVVAVIVDSPSSRHERPTNIEHPVGCLVAQYRSQPVEKGQPEEQATKDTSTSYLSSRHKFSSILCANARNRVAGQLLITGVAVEKLTLSKVTEISLR